MTTIDLRLKFAEEESIPYDIVVENIPTTPGEVYGNNYPIKYIIWLQEQLLILIKNKEDVKRFKEKIVKLEQELRECLEE